MTTTVALNTASNPSLAGNVARHEEAHSEFFFDSYCEFTTPNEQTTKQMPAQSYVASTTCTSDFCCNQQYSVTAITTAVGAIAERYAYTAYGLPTILNASATIIASSAISNRYTYTGREWDATLGLHHFRARWMSPFGGRFLGRDPIGYLESDNLYLFTLALWDVDPSGNGTEKGVGTAMLRALEGTLSRLCEKCCPKCQCGECPSPLTLINCCDSCCIKQAKEMAQHILDTWKDNHGRGSNKSKDNVGGYLCWDWAKAFRDAALKGPNVCWTIEVEGIAQIKPKGPVHFFTTFTACGNPAQECTIALDDGWFDGKMIHFMPWPNDPNWKPTNWWPPSNRWTNPPIIVK